VRDNFIKEEVAQEVAALIRDCPELRALNLSDCNLTEDENEVIITALEVKNRYIFSNRNKHLLFIK
jgi:Ran GTPase-activating protein (RanGAP) involved in mRNA processing and transport